MRTCVCVCVHVHTNGACVKWRGGGGGGGLSNSDFGTATDKCQVKDCWSNSVCQGVKQSPAPNIQLPATLVGHGTRASVKIW